VLVVLASRLDTAARSLVDSWSRAGCALLSAEDLGTTGWSFRVADPAGGTAVVAGERVPVRKIRAVLTRRPAIVAEELRWIDPADRGYVAREANAFLIAWLHAIPCPVINRPTATSLAGPAWSPLHWAAAAARAGVAWGPRSDDDGVHEVTVCAGACAGARSCEEAARARALADAAGVSLLGVHFAGAHACGATTMPDLSGHEVRDALLEHVTGASR
jgi:hypothetical protein